LASGSTNMESDGIRPQLRASVLLSPQSHPVVLHGPPLPHPQPMSDPGPLFGKSTSSGVVNSIAGSPGSPSI